MPINIGDMLGGLGRYFYNNDEIQWGNVLPLIGGIAASQAKPTRKPSGYQGGIPQLTAVRQQVPGTYDPTRRPGSGGQRYFTDTQFVAPNAVGAAQTQATQQGQQLAAQNAANPARQQAPLPMTMANNPQVKDKVTAWAVQNNMDPNAVWVKFLAAINSGEVTGPRGLEAFKQRNTPGKAAGGLASLPPRRLYLGGSTDGMADKVPANIAGKENVNLADGEFIVPADVVSDLGNGNSNAGANALYKMMERTRLARRGTPKQGRQINPQAVMPR